MLIWTALLVAAGVALAFFQASAFWWWAVAAALVLAGMPVAGFSETTMMVLAGVWAAYGLLFVFTPLRRALLSRPMLGVFRKIMPNMSQTERDAIEAGTVWWDGDLFSGKPDWNKLAKMPKPGLTKEEQDFVDNETEQLCDMANDWETTSVWQDLPPQTWQFIKDKGFLGMIIPKEYGGKGFSAQAHSAVIMKLSTRCSAAAISVMVPNSLGPAELLLHYGTKQQKDYYLPRLARGEEIPCFALTSPYAGSDAAAIPDVGIVCKQMFNGVETLGFRVTWNKRYITLAPVATVLGLAFRVQDPDGLLGKGEDVGITCALIPTNHEGVIIGRRHFPLNGVFHNGPTQGNDVFIPVDWVIGGAAQVGGGWRMLMECLAAGRCISLPSSNVGMAKLAVRGTSAYSAVRKQFKMPIGKFEGVQEAMTRMGGNLYAMDAVRSLSALAVDLGEKPSVVSAIAKYHVTERARKVVNDGMDVIGGKGICMGPNNFLARAYQQIPIAITVEGANILTRSLIIFGQGAIRCHPYVFRLMVAARDTDTSKALPAFDKALFGHISFIFANLARTLVHGLTGGRLAGAPSGATAELRQYYRAATRLSAALALLTDVSMFSLGASLKRREKITARLGDVLSQLYILSATLKRYEDEGRQRADLPFVHWAAQDSLQQAQEAIRGVLANFPNRLVARVLGGLIFPFGSPYSAPNDDLGAAVAEAMLTPGGANERLTAGSYCPAPQTDQIGYLKTAFDALPKIQELENRLKPAIKDGRIAAMPQSLRLLQDWVDEAVARKLLTTDEGRLFAQYAREVDIIVQVDDFPKDFGLADGLRQRDEGRLQLVERVA